MTAPPRPTRVLLADDSEGLRLLMRSWLTGEDDLEVVAEATNGAEAVALADAHRPDVVVLDVAMPVMDGLEALTELQRRFPDMPVVMHSGFAEGQVARQAVARGARAFVEKSGDLDPLLVALRAAALPAVPAPRAALPDAEPGAATQVRPVPAPEPPEAPPARRPALLPLAVTVLLALGLLGWALAVPDATALHVLPTAAAWAAAGLLLGPALGGRRRAEQQQRLVSDAVVAGNRALAEANDLLVRLNADLQASNDDLRQFGQIAGHDLVEPLRTVDSLASQLADRYGPLLDDGGREQLCLVVDGVRRTRALVDDLRAYTRAGQAPLALVPVDLTDVVADVAASLRLRLAECRAELRVGALPVVPGDRALLGLVLQNLVANALTFTTSPTPLVEVDAVRTGEHWEVRVSDDGTGIDPEHADTVFGLFTRLHTRGEHPGTGLGLAIAKRVVERHGGTIRLGPRPGGGTTVVLSLPAA